MLLTKELNLVFKGIWCAGWIWSSTLCEACL